MVNVAKLSIGKEISLTEHNCHSLNWFIHIKTEPLEDGHSRDIYLKIYVYAPRGDSPYTEYEFRQYDQRFCTWRQFSLFIKTTENIWNQYSATIVDVYVKSHRLNIKGRLDSMLVSHSNLDDKGNIFQLDFSSSSLDVELQSYKEVNLY